MYRFSVLLKLATLSKMILHLKKNKMQEAFTKENIHDFYNRKYYLQ